MALTAVVSSNAIDLLTPETSMELFVLFLQSIPITRFQAGLERCRTKHRDHRRSMVANNRPAWLASFDKNGNYLHWSGYWESTTGWCFFGGRWVWLVPETEDPDSA